MLRQPGRRRCSAVSPWVSKSMARLKRYLRATIECQGGARAIWPSLSPSSSRFDGRSPPGEREIVVARGWRRESRDFYLRGMRVWTGNMLDDAGGRRGRRGAGPGVTCNAGNGVAAMLD